MAQGVRLIYSSLTQNASVFPACIVMQFGLDNLNQIGLGQERSSAENGRAPKTRAENRRVRAGLKISGVDFSGRIRKGLELLCFTTFLLL